MPLSILIWESVTIHTIIVALIDISTPQTTLVSVYTSFRYVLESHYHRPPHLHFSQVIFASRLTLINLCDFDIFSLLLII